MPKNAVGRLHNVTLRVLLAQAEALARSQRVDPDPDPEAMRERTEQAGNLGRATAALTAEIRKNADQVLDQLASLPAERKAALVLDLVEDLPLEHRQAVAAKLAELGSGL